MSIQRKAEAVVAKLLGESPESPGHIDPASGQGNDRVIKQFETWLNSKAKPGTETNTGVEVDGDGHDVIFSWQNGVLDPDSPDHRYIVVYVNDDLNVGAYAVASAQYAPNLEPTVPLVVNGTLNPKLLDRLSKIDSRGANPMGEEWWGFPEGSSEGVAPDDEDDDM
jgi:hypothetical protein